MNEFIKTAVGAAFCLLLSLEGIVMDPVPCNAVNEGSGYRLYNRGANAFASSERGSRVTVNNLAPNNTYMIFKFKSSSGGSYNIVWKSNVNNGWHAKWQTRFDNDGFIETWTGTSDQWKWLFETGADGYCIIKNVFSGKYLDARRGLDDEVRQWDRNASSPFQEWQFFVEEQNPGNLVLHGRKRGRMSHRHYVLCTIQ